MRVNQATIDLIKRFEGWRAEAYRDAVGVWTIGYGHTSAAGAPEVRPGMKITKTRGEEILRTDVEKFAKGVESLVKAALSENQFGALVSFAYNVGLGNFRKSSVLGVVNSGQLSRVPDRLALWNKAGGRVLKGLVRRRGKEGELFSQEDDQVIADNKTLHGFEEHPEPSSDALRLGGQGMRVKDLQRQLSNLGYFPGTIDGGFGKRTRAAVLAFQADNGLATDGIAGAATFKAFDDAPPRQISNSRETASLATLAEGGSRIADASVKNIAAGGLASTFGIGGLLADFSGTFQELKGSIDPIVEPFGGLNTFMLVALVAVVGFMTWQSIRAGRARTSDHRTGKTS